MIFENEFDRELANCINESAKGHSRNCVRSAIRHIEMAWKIKDIDPEMAVFRAITAEEEAATAIFLALKEQRYEGANKIKYKKHPYKLALEPFIRSICKFSEKWSKFPGFPFGDKFQLKIVGEGKEQKLEISFHYKEGLITSIPPLGFEITKTGKPYHFEEELLEITSLKNREEFIKHIQEVANQRNQVLYAQPNGIPNVQNAEGYIRRRKDIVFILLRVFALIYPYKEKALFVQQALSAFLTMMGDIEDAVCE
jgi:hypothetical protein